MLPRLWFFAILSPLALGVPVHRKSVSPSLTPRYSKFNTKTLNSRVNMVLNRAGRASRKKGYASQAGTKTTSENKGSPFLDGYSAHGTGVSSSGQGSMISGQGSKIELPNSLSTGIPGVTSLGTLSDQGTTKELKDWGFFKGGYGKHRGTTHRVIAEESVNLHGSGNGVDGASHTTGDGTIKVSIDGCTIGSKKTASGITTGSKGTTGSNGTIAST